MIEFPVRVLLRDKSQATINEAIVTGMEICNSEKPGMDRVFLCGIAEKQYHRWYDMWRPDGKWRYSGEPHANDIVGIAMDGKQFTPLTDEFTK